MCIHKRINSVCFPDRTLNICYFHDSILGKLYLVPKNLRPVVTQEMINLKMIERINRDVIKVKELKFDPEENVNKLSEMVGLF